MRGRSKQKVLESDQRVEDYIKNLNRNDQYGVVLYSNNELIVPGPTKDDDCEARVYIPGRTLVTVPPLETGLCYWHSLERKVPVPEGKKKNILMTFEAVEAAVFAFQYSFPVICVDACTIKCPHVSAVLMTATFETTDGRLLTMCYGTAPSESNQSWSFFLLNLRQALQKYCHSLRSYDQVVFMSDRHKGILKGVSTHFPSSKHLYCIFHLLLNLSRRSILPYHQKHQKQL